VTVEIHVREDLGDADVLELTRWASARCSEALRFGSGGGSGRGEGAEVKAEVTVGVVRG
jgi:hypothetical protein